jgi:hypothetical protein
MPHMSDLLRRDVLRAGAVLAATAATGAWPRSALAGSLLQPLAGAPKTRHVVLVVFGGGVRSRETIETPANVPNLLRIAERGVLYPSTRVVNNGHYGAAMSIFTGSSESIGIRENERSSNPTLFEYLRRDAKLTASDVWLSTSGSDQETNYAYSTDSRFGGRYGANLIGAEGVFNAEFKAVVAGDKGLAQPDPRQEELMQRMRAAVSTPLPSAEGPGVGNDQEASARIEQYVLEELRGSTSEITGLGANDVKALRVARNLLAIFRPRLLAITLRAPDVAHGSFNDYVSTIRRNDEELGALYDAIRRDAELRDSTALFVLPEFGRDRDLNERRGLDHGDDSDELHKIALVAAGPDFKQGKVSTAEVASIDVCPTIAGLFGVRSAGSRGGQLPGLFA